MLAHGQSLTPGWLRSIHWLSTVSAVAVEAGSSLAVYWWISQPELARVFAMAAAAGSLLYWPWGTIAGASILAATTPSWFSKVKDTSPDRTQKSASASRYAWYLLTAQFALIIPGNMIVFEYSANHGYKQYPIFLFLVLLLGVSTIETVIHEAGHAIGGWIGGMKITIFAVGPVCLTRMADGWRYSWMPEIRLSGSGGQAGGILRSSENIFSTLLLFHAGAALAETLAGTLATLLFLSCSDHPALRPFGLLFGIWAVSAYSGLLNLIPLRTPGLNSDGAAILGLWREGDHGSRYKLVSLTWTTGLRPRDWELQWLTHMTSEPAGRTLALGARYSYMYHLDRGEVDLAGEWLDKCVETQRANRKYLLGRKGTACEAAYFEGFYRRNAVEARRWITKKSHGYPVDKFAELRAEAAVLFAEGEPEKAVARARESLTLIDSCRQNGWTTWNRELVVQLIDCSCSAPTDRNPASDPASPPLAVQFNAS